jgi:hypothetical protein
VRGPINKLSDTKIESALKTARKAVAAGGGKPILLGDGGGLTLQISKTGAASWLHRYMRLGKAVGLGLGGYPEVSLKLARAKAEECRRILAEGNDPLTESGLRRQRSNWHGPKEKPSTTVPPSTSMTIGPNGRTRSTFNNGRTPLRTTHRRSLACAPSAKSPPPT